MESNQGFDEISERMWVVDPMGSYPLVLEGYGPLISQQRDFRILGIEDSKDREQEEHLHHGFLNRKSQ
jgi:hypothetical protein